jgi:hypothetical protein
MASPPFCLGGQAFIFVIARRVIVKATSAGRSLA